MFNLLFPFMSGPAFYHHMRFRPCEASREEKVEQKPKERSGHPDPATVGANPSGTVAQSPLVLVKTAFADLKAAWAVQTVGQDLPAAMALKFHTPSPAGGGIVFGCHHFTSFSIRYPAISGNPCYQR
jgi:hypothetical protein